MTSNGLLSGVVELAATYLAQSTLFLTTGWLVLQILAWGTRWKRGQSGRGSTGLAGGSPWLSERVWKFSAALALVTAPLSLMCEWGQPAWVWTLPASSDSVGRDPVEASKVASSIHSETDSDITSNSEMVIDTNAVHVTDRESASIETPLPRPWAQSSVEWSVDERDQEADFRVMNRGAGDFEASLTSTQSDAARLSPVGPPHKPRRSASPDGGIAGLGCLLLGWILLSLGRLSMKSLTLRRTLARCRPINGPPRRLLNELFSRGHDVRLLASNADTGPFACGIHRWTIVLPEGIEQQLSPAELKGLLAHEVAHLVRRDPVWQWLGELLCTCLAFQPLNFLARRRWQQATELLCDDWAVNQRISATTLAECLTRIAEWRLNRREAAIGLAAVGHPAMLTQRIEWLLRPRLVTESGRSRRSMLATLTLCVTGLLVGIHGPRLSLVDVVRAEESLIDVESDTDWGDIRQDLVKTLATIDRMELQFADDPEITLLVTRLRERAVSLTHQLE
jgi:beta-lactamase regulating signal transducer with metallopeptidase domain